MRKYLAATMICLALVSLYTVSGCKQYEHKKEEKVIKKERSEAKKSVSDLNEAILITDQSGWDSAKDYRQFMDTSMKRISVCRARILHFKENAGRAQRKMPGRHEIRINKLEKRSLELEEKLSHYTLKDKSDWEDFTKLFNYDLYQLEESVKKLN